MAIRRFTSVQEVMRMIYRYYKDDIELNTLELMEFMDDALNLIGVKGQYEDLIVEIPIANHRGVVPCGFIEEIQLQGTNGAPMVENNATIIPNTEDIEENEQYIAGREADDDLLVRRIVPQVNGYEQSYYFDDRCIYTSIEEGTIIMNYVGIRVDADGYPMIPDIVEFKLALMWYCIKSILFRKLLNGGVNLEGLIQKSEVEWNKYQRGAVDQANMFTLPQLENFKRNWVRLVPRTNEFKSFYSGLSYPEQRYNNT